MFKQIRNVLDYLRSMVLAEKVIKIADRAEALRVWNYPYAAVEEAVVNAFYHRSYDNVSPIEISVYPDQMRILSFPGPLPPINQNSLKQKKVLSRDYRNRRIGDFLKELEYTEGRNTGFPIIYDKMERNGSLDPIFETDDISTHFLTVLPVHPEFLKAFQEEEARKDVFENMTNKEQVLFLIGQNSKITTKEISEETGIPLRTIKRLFAELINKDMIIRKGSRKNGEWFMK